MKIRLEIEIDDDTMQIREVLKTTLIPSTFLDGSPLREELEGLGSGTFWTIVERKAEDDAVIGAVSLHQSWF